MLLVKPIPSPDVVPPMNTLPGSDASVDPAVELPLLAAMTENALAAGYRALRVFARGTGRDDAQAVVLRPAH